MEKRIVIDAPLTDSEKLRFLAEWFDNNKKPWAKVKDDLIRIADEMEQK